MTQKKISFPHMGNYFYVFKPLAELLGDEVIIPPPITKRTIEIGTKHSPEFVCVPFKYNLGNYIEALEKGANVLIQAGGGCRFGHYGELQERILRDLGYEFTFFKLVNDFGPVGFIKDFKKINPRTPYSKIINKIILCYFRLRVFDIIENLIRKNIGFETQKGEFDKIHASFLKDLDKTYSLKAVYFVKKKYLAEISNIKTNKPEKPIKVGVVGELYILMEPFSNFYLEKELAKKGIEVHRFVTVSSILHETLTGNLFFKKHLHEASPYLKYHLGAHGTESVAKTHKLIKNEFDGIIHLKPFGCMPEVSAMSVLNKVSKDYNFPVIYFSFDSQTSETGIKTRLEAFYDMLSMKRNSLNLNYGT